MNMNEKNKIENCRIEPKLKLINMDSVEVEQVEWLLYPFIPYGKVTIIQGDPGEGKTTMVLQIIAKLTRGEPILPVTDTTKTKEKRSDEVDSENEDLDAEDNMQEQSSVSPVNVIYQTAEDGLGDTIKPRLLAAGADCSKVLVIDDSDQPLTMADVRLEEAIVQTKAKMVVLDPIQGFLGADVDMHRANEIRPLMKRIAVLSEKYHCAVILIGHMNKNSNGKSSYRGLGSIDFQAAARSVLIVGRVKDEPEVRVVCHTKSSLAPEGTSIASQKQEMGTLKSIGMTNKQLKQAFMMEGLFTTLIALLITAVVGIPGGYAIGIFLKNAGMSTGFVFPVVAFTLFAVAMFMLESLMIILPFMEEAICYCNNAKLTIESFSYLGQLNNYITLLIQPVRKFFRAGRSCFYSLFSL